MFRVLLVHLGILPTGNWLSEPIPCSMTMKKSLFQLAGGCLFLDNHTLRVICFSEVDSANVKFPSEEQRAQCAAT